MTQDEYEVGSLEDAEKFTIIRMAREAGLLVFQSSFCGTSFDFTLEQLERFYQLAFAAGAAHEREVCAKVCDELKATYELDGLNGTKSYHEVAAAIRVRGEK